MLAHVLGLLQIARDYEASGGLSFRGFVDYLDALAESPDRHDQPVAEDGDPSLYDAEVTMKPGVRQHAILQPGPGDDPGEGARQYQAWLARRGALIERGIEESFRVATVTGLVDEAPDAGAGGVEAVEVHELEGRDPGRPSGKRFGSLVHELLARTALETTESELRALARSLGRVLGNTDDEIDAAPPTVARALEHPILARARAAESCYREMPLVHRENDGRLIEGVTDLVFLENAGWTVVDFKTDVRIDLTAETYRRQVALYLLAIEAAAGRPASGALLYV